MNEASSEANQSIDFATSFGMFIWLSRGTSWAASTRNVLFYPSFKLSDSFFCLAEVAVTPAATALILIPWKAVSKAEHLTSILSIDIDVEYITDPGCGVSPAVEERTVTEPFVNFKKGVAREIN